MVFMKDERYLTLPKKPQEKARDFCRHEIQVRFPYFIYEFTLSSPK